MIKILFAVKGYEHTRLLLENYGFMSFLVDILMLGGFL